MREPTPARQIAFLISDQHFIPHGGIGQFAKGFTEMCSRFGWKVDMVLDNQGKLALMELEMIEPELWLRKHPPSAMLFAESIARIVKG